ncbi:MAG TPA: lycopene cyclase domain-containing protein [Spirochaetota bacterium]|nr:lycopene cyclase domain-containing protein [Spirochaetota bacterium]
MTYNFLLLDLLLLIPALIIYILRSDLRRVMLIMALFALPFAATEFLFYPEYWQPVFLFDLINYIGFGIEDIIFVTVLAGLSSTIYAFCFRQKYVSLRSAALKKSIKKGIYLLLISFTMLIILLYFDAAPIYSALIIMSTVSTVLLIYRYDLLVPALSGATITLVLYTGACILLKLLLPGIFQMSWNTDKFSNIFLFNIPLEELLYGFAAGLTGTVFYPAVFARKLVPRK